MTTSQSIINIASALLLAQKKIGAATKDAVNPFFKSSYADLGSVMEACKSELNDNGITVLQPVGTDERGVYVETVLLHTSGEWISDKMTLAVKEGNNPQAQGSAISYARRYSLQSMLFIPAEDDDAEKATPHIKESKEANTAFLDKDQPLSEKKLVCAIHGEPMKSRGFYNGEQIFDHRKQIDGIWNKCNGITDWQQS